MPRARRSRNMLSCQSVPKLKSRLSYHPFPNMRENVLPSITGAVCLLTDWHLSPSHPQSHPTTTQKSPNHNKSLIHCSQLTSLYFLRGLDWENESEWTRKTKIGEKKERSSWRWAKHLTYTGLEERNLWQWILIRVGGRPLQIFFLKNRCKDKDQMCFLTFQSSDF